MILDVTCPICDKKYKLEVPDAAYKKWKSGELVQRAWPEGTSTQRESLITGMCPDCQEEIFG